jgi:hypothetical protein
MFIVAALRTLTVGGVLASVSANAANLFLRASADTTLMENYPTNNLGGEQYFNAGSIQNPSGTNAAFPYPRNRGLIKFDVAGSLPPGSLVTSVSLVLDVVLVPIDNPNSSAAYAIHRVFRDWGEGVQTNRVTPPQFSPVGLGYPAAPNEATWFHRFAHTTNTWASPGGAAGIDYATNASAVRVILGPAFAPFYVNSTSNLVADVQFWLDHPERNFGWMVKALDETEGWTARRFMARESVGNLYPAISVDFIPPPVLRNFQKTNNLFLFSFTAEEGQSYRAQYTESLDPVFWHPLTNIPAPPFRTEVVVSDQLLSTTRYYRVVAP